MKSIAVLCLVILASNALPTGLARAEPSVTTDSIKATGIVSRGDLSRLRAVIAKARRGEEICVAAIGGSITAGYFLQTKDPKNRYIAKVAEWFTQTFPAAKVTFVNAGIGGTNSPLRRDAGAGRCAG